MSLQAFIKNTIPREDGLFGKIYRFNHRIGDYIDGSHLDDVLLRKLCVVENRSRRFGLKLSEYLLDHLGLRGHYFYNFEEPRLRLALVEGPALTKLMRFAGAALYADRMNKVILKDRVIALKQAIGDDVYYFASKRAVLLQALIPSIPLEYEVEDLTADRLFDVGRHCLEVCFAHEAGELLQRLQLKFPKNIAWRFGVDAPEEVKTRCWNYLYRILIKDIQPNWKSCFT